MARPTGPVKHFQFWLRQEPLNPQIAAASPQERLASAKQITKQQLKVYAERTTPPLWPPNPLIRIAGSSVRLQ